MSLDSRVEVTTGGAGAAAASEPAARRAAIAGALAELAEEGALRLPVRGRCMEPALPHGAEIEVRAARLYLPGDLVAFRDEEGRTLVHRLLGYLRWRGAWCVVTQADAAPRPDRPVPSARLLGRAVQPGVPARGIPLALRAAALGRFLGWAWAGLWRHR